MVFALLLKVVHKELISPLEFHPKLGMVLLPFQKERLNLSLELRANPSYFVLCLSHSTGCESAERRVDQG